MSDQTLEQLSYPERLWNLLEHWRQARHSYVPHQQSSSFAFSLYTIPVFHPHFGLEGFIYSFQYPSLMTVWPRKRQFADTNDISCPFVPCSAEALSLCPNSLSCLCRQGPHLMNLLMLPGDYENQETSLRMI